jgi:hypothetical protein
MTLKTFFTSQENEQNRMLVCGNRRYWPGLARNLQALTGKLLGRFVESRFAENQQADVV